MPVEIHLADPELDPSTGLPRYAPGAVASGLVRIRFEPDEPAWWCYVVARWRTSGEGEVDEAQGLRHLLQPGDRHITFPRSFEATFSYELPLAPWSYVGRLISIGWQIEAHLHGKSDNQESGSVSVAPFILAPRGSPSP